MMQGYGWYGETMWMGDWGLTHGVMMVALLALILYPVGLILRRLGYSPLWAALAFVPVVNLVGLWIVALDVRRS
ncbi:MAG: hypothetical protein LCH88_00010 [Proteobacteria bacterium]|jgi:hypothetical protein|nr:hypothetical protein [Pseudomonadota bacterium]MCA0339115.1 hypothetical protein [Pseudomonadota bacterium]